MRFRFSELPVGSYFVCKGDLDRMEKPVATLFLKVDEKLVMNLALRNTEKVENGSELEVQQIAT